MILLQVIKVLQKKALYQSSNHDGFTVTELLVTVFSVSILLMALIPLMGFINRGARAQIDEQYLQDSINTFFASISRDTRNAILYELEDNKTINIESQDNKLIRYELIMNNDTLVLERNIEEIQDNGNSLLRKVAMIEFKPPTILKNFLFEDIEEDNVKSLKITIDVSVPPGGGVTSPQLDQYINKNFSTVVTRRNPT